MQLTQALFWDTDVTKLDFKKNKVAIIQRILMRGTFEQFKEMLAFYGRRTVKSVAKNARYLDKYTLAFCSVIFKIPKTQFRCYKFAQSNPTHWDF